MSNFWQQVKQSLSPLVRGSKHLVGGVAGSLRQQATMQKLAIRIRALKRERSEIVKTIGKKVYFLYTQGNVRNRDVLSDCQRLDEAGQEIETLRQQMEEVRSQAAAGEQLVVEIEEQTPLTKEAEEEAEPAEPPEEQTAQPWMQE